MSHKKRIMVGLAGIVIATCIWLPSVHFFYSRPASTFLQPEGISPKARQLAARHLQLWNDPKRNAG